VIAPNGTALSRSVPITVTAATASPSLVLQKQPSGVDRLLRQASVLNPELNAGAAAYQWFRNGMRLPGATGRELTVPSSRLGGEDIYQLLATDETGAAILSRQISVRTRDFSAWAGSFQSLLFDARSERVRGRATVSITSQGGVSGVFHWESAVFRMAGQLGSDLKLESGTRGADAENVKCVLHCDTEEGLVVFSIQKGALTVASGSHSIRPGIRSFPLGFSAPVERSLLLESLGTQASGVLSGISGPLGVARWRRESPRTVLSFAKMADGSAWTCSSIPLKDASFVCFSSFVSPYPRSKAWIGGVVSEQETASGQFLDWFRTAPPDGPASAACDARLFLSASGFSSGAFLNERRFAATAGALDLQTKQPDGVLRNIPFQWSPGSLVLRSLFASSVFSDVSLNIHPRTGFVWGVSGGGSVTAPNSGRFEWTGLIFPMDANGPYRVRGFVRKTPWPEWITPFELLPQDAP
jgi:hypothetical protein